MSSGCPSLRSGICAIIGSITFAVNGTTISLARELGPKGIRVNAVAPGLLDTEMKNELNTDELEFWQKHTVLRRIGTANDVASAVAFLASDDASFINGQIIRIDGGLL